MDSVTDKDVLTDWTWRVRERGVKEDMQVSTPNRVLRPLCPEKSNSIPVLGSRGLSGGFLIIIFSSHLLLWFLTCVHLLIPSLSCGAFLPTCTSLSFLTVHCPPYIPIWDHFCCCSFLVFGCFMENKSDPPVEGLGRALLRITGFWHPLSHLLPSGLPPPETPVSEWSVF